VVKEKETDVEILYETAKIKEEVINS